MSDDRACIPIKIAKMRVERGEGETVREARRIGPRERVEGENGSSLHFWLNNRYFLGAPHCNLGSMHTSLTSSQVCPSGRTYDVNDVKIQKDRRLPD
jgi:hypothetical protein